MSEIWKPSSIVRLKDSEDNALYEVINKRPNADVYWITKDNRDNEFSIKKEQLILVCSAENRKDINAE